MKMLLQSPLLFAMLTLTAEDIYPCAMGMTLSGHATGTVTVAELPSYATYTTTYLTGSICPLTSGSYTLYCEGVNSVEVTFNGTTKGDDEDGRCLSSSTSGSVTKTLYAHYCYPFSMRYNTGCGYSRYANLYITPPGGSQAILDSTYTMQCDWSDCVYDYYGPTCANYCDVYCNGNGYCSNGTSGTGKCVCTSYSSDTFCENTASNRFVSSAQGLYMYTYNTETFSDLLSTSTITSFPVSGLTFAYQSVSIEGYLYIPQNGYYDFEAISTTSPQLIINGTTYGSLPQTNDCSTTPTMYTISAGKQFHSIGLTPFKLRSNVGCPMLDHNFTLYWKFYRYYDNSDSTPWELFPSRYLTNED